MVVKAQDANLQDDPRAYIAESRRRALADGAALPDTVTGAGLFEYWSNRSDRLLLGQCRLGR